METDSAVLVAAASSSASDETGPRTIVNGILESDLPPAEKSLERICDEVTTVSGAGFETSAGVLRLIIFHVFTNQEILQQLRKELVSAKATPHETVELGKLEQLPYLTSVLMEGLCLSPGIATRLQRIAPCQELVYNQWRIPAGTSVGMTNLWMHLDETLYPDPRRFNPDRWMDIDERKILDRKFAPFSKGTRSCLGMK